MHVHCKYPPLQIPHLNLRKVSLELEQDTMICGNLRHQWPQDSSFSTLPNFVFYARTLRGPRRALLPPGLGVTKLKLWSVWKVYWACPWVLGMTEYIDSLYGDHRDRSDHGSNNWWWWAGWILTRWWPRGSVRFGGLTAMWRASLAV